MYSVLDTCVYVIRREVKVGYSTIPLHINISSCFIRIMRKHCIIYTSTAYNQLGFLNIVTPTAITIPNTITDSTNMSIFGDSFLSFESE